MLAEQEEVTALTLPQRAQVALGADEHEKQLKLLVEQSKRIVELKNKDAREECHSAAMVLTRTLTGIDKAGKDAREDANKFQTAVIAEVKRLTAIAEPEKKRLLALRDEYDAEVEAEKQRKIAAERRRIESIQALIGLVRDIPLSLIGKSSAEISAAIDKLAMEKDFSIFEEFSDDYKAVRLDVLDKLAKAETAARGVEIEAEARRQEEARQKLEREEEAARLKLEREELARQRVEQERIAAENAKVAQEAEAERRRQQADAQAQLQAALEKMEAEAAKRQHELDSERAELDREKAAIAQQKADEESAKFQAEVDAYKELTAKAEEAKADANVQNIAAMLVNAPVGNGPSALLEPDAKALGDAELDEIIAGPSDHQMICAVAEKFNLPVFVAAELMRKIDYEEWM